MRLPRLTSLRSSALGSLVLLDRKQAARLLNRSPLTIRDWQIKHSLPVARRDGRRVLYDSRVLLAMAKQRRANYRDRPFTPGLGRGVKHPATPEIERRVEAGEMPADIAEACSCSVSTVYRIRRKIEALKSTQKPEQDSGG